MTCGEKGNKVRTRVHATAVAQRNNWKNRNKDTHTYVPMYLLTYIRTDDTSKHGVKGWTMNTRGERFLCTINCHWTVHLLNEYLVWIYNLLHTYMTLVWFSKEMHCERLEKYEDFAKKYRKIYLKVNILGQFLFWVSCDLYRTI